MPGQYLDLYLLPVPKAHLERYREQAEAFGQLLVELGALSYRELVADDLVSEGALTFSRALSASDDEVVTSAIAEFHSRSHRDEVMAKLEVDSRARALMDTAPIADMTRMHYAGFKLMVSR